MNDITTDFTAILNSPTPALTDAQVDELLASGSPEYICRLGLVAAISAASLAKMRAACAEIEIKRNEAT